MFNIKAQTVTAARQDRVEALLSALVETTATDLKEGTTTRDIAIPALSKIVTAVIPSTGKGHADNIAAQVSDAVDAAMLAMEDTDSDSDDSEAA